MARNTRSHAMMVDPSAISGSIYTFFVRRNKTFFGKPLRKGDRLEVRSDEQDKLSRALTLAGPLSGIFRLEATTPLEKQPKRGKKTLSRLESEELKEPEEAGDDEPTED